MSSAIRLKFCAVNAGIKNYKSVNKKNKNKNDKMRSLAKSKLNTIEALISKALIDSNISYDKFVLINHVLEELYDMKEEIKSSKEEKFKLHIK